MKRITSQLLIILVCFTCFYVNSQAQMIWEGKANVCSGLNFDLGIYDSVLVVMSDKYYELNTKGETLFSDTTVIDEGQAVWDYDPVLTITKNGTVHIITRGAGKKEKGFELLYHSKKIGSASWIHKNVVIGNPVPRNYVVEIVPTSDTNTLYFAHMSIVGDNVNANIHFYKMTNTVVDSLGAFDSINYQRADADFRMEVFNDTLYLLSGYPDPSGVVYFMRAKLDDNLPVNLEESRIPFTMGEKRKGCPNIAIDTTGSIHILYGSKYKCHYHKLYRDGLEQTLGKTTFHNLNEWSLQHGIGAMAVSSNGKYLLSLALQTDGTGADNCEILWNVSNNGGDSWTYQKELGFTTNGTEGRIRPRIVSLDSAFYTLFYDKSVSGLTFQKIVLNDSIIPMAPKPQFLPEAEEYQGILEVTFANQSELTLFYETSGLVPSLDSKEYSDKYTSVRSQIQINVMACQPGLLPSYASKTYSLAEVSALQNISNEYSPLLLCYPNPFIDRVSIQLNNSYIGKAQIQITDIQGRILKSMDIYKSAITEIFEYSLKNIKNRTLIINIIFEGNIHRALLLHN